MPIVLGKTNLYSQVSVLRCIDLIDRYFTKVTARRPLPSDFPSLNLLLQAFRMILEMDSILCSNRVLHFIYKFFPSLGLEFQRSLSFALLGNLFTTLFYHWSYQIRAAFHYLLIVRIAQCQELKNDPNFMERYEMILRIIVNA